MAAALEGATDTVVISFIDLYRKVQRNFPEARVLSREDRLLLGKEMVQIAAAHGVRPARQRDRDQLGFLR